MPGFEIKVTIENKDDFLSNFKGFTDGYPAAVGSGMKVVGDRILETGNMLVPVRTGFLRSTMGINQDSYFQMTLYARAPYAGFVEFGARRITPRLFMTRSLQQHSAEFSEEVKAAIMRLCESLFGV